MFFCFQYAILFRPIADRAGHLGQAVYLHYLVFTYITIAFWMKRATLAKASDGFVSDSWAFLFVMVTESAGDYRPYTVIVIVYRTHTLVRLQHLTVTITYRRG